MDQQTVLFSNKSLKAMIIPLFLEQLLIMLVGMADTLVVSYAGEAAVSGVSLVNQFNTIFIYLFTALASGVFSTSMAWELVEEDLDAASGFLNGLSADSFYYVSPAAVTALKARVKLYLGKKGEAKELAESLIANPNYALDDFDKIFRSKANKEVIFAFSCLTEDGSSIKISNQFYSYNHPNKGSYNYRPAGDVMTMYADNDLRKEVSITTLDNLNFVNKYPSGQTGSDPVVISRLAEMYLISAEAQGLNGGLDRLNELREKRGLDRVSPGNEADFLDAVLQERRLEFLAEGFRWYDLVRTGKATQTLGTKDYQCLMPLPSRELLYNPNLKPNNPGY